MKTDELNKLAAKLWKEDYGTDRAPPFIFAARLHDAILEAEAPVAAPPDNVVFLNCVTRLDLPPDMILESAKGKLKGLVILGYDNDDEEYFASTYADGCDVLWLLERYKKLLLAED
jgi:hypothetical protein